jgi:hypothetical protein
LGKLGPLLLRVLVSALEWGRLEPAEVRCDDRPTLKRGHGLGLAGERRSPSAASRGGTKRGSSGFGVGPRMRVGSRPALSRRRTGRDARHRAVPPPAGNRESMDRDTSGFDRPRRTRRCVSGPRGASGVDLPGVRRGLALVRPRGRAGVAALGQLSIPDPPARASAAGAASDTRQPAPALDDLEHRPQRRLLIHVGPTTLL